MHSVYAQKIDSLNLASKKAYQSGDYLMALELAQRAFNETEKKNLSNLHLYNSLSNIGYAQMGLTQYQESLITFKKLKELSFTNISQPHFLQLEALHELAKAYLNLSIYDSAAMTIEQAAPILAQLLKDKKEDPDNYPFELLDVEFKIHAIDAIIHNQLGQTAEAIKILELNKRKIQATYPDIYPSVPDYQTTINNLSTYNLMMNELSTAKKYALEYYQLSQTSKLNTVEIAALTNLGSIYRKLLNFDSALIFWQLAEKKIQENEMQNTYNYLALLNNVGELHFETENYEIAIASFQKATAILKKQSYPNPYQREIINFNLAESYYFGGYYAAADTAYQLLIEEVLEDLQHHFTYLSDAEKLAYYNKQRTIIESFTNFTLEVCGLPALQGSEHPYENDALIGQLYNLQLNTKAIILNASKRMKKNILSSGDNVLVDRYLKWIALKQNLAAVSFENSKMGAKQISNLKEEVEEQEKWLVTHSRKFKDGFQLENTSWQYIQKALKVDEAAIEIVRLANGVAYGALILTAKTIDKPVFCVILSSKSKLLEEESLKAYKNAIKYQLEDPLSHAVYWQPIMEKVIENMPDNLQPSQVYISAEGIYNQININTLYDTTQHNYVLDQTSIIQLTNTKEILSLSNQYSKNPSPIISLFGDVDFSNFKQVNQSFSPLPGTAKEIKQIQEITNKADWSTKVYMGKQASEEELKKIQNISILHIASHGYFKPMVAEAPFSMTQSLLASGIILAHSAENSSVEDGLLTAYEASGLSLDNAPLVVLSACETALGTSYHGEGIYGLQRAFRVAGAKHILMSLWKVNDEATQELMTLFYQNWTSGLELRKAFIMAQKSLRKKYSHPFYWGAFILTGN